MNRQEYAFLQAYKAKPLHRFKELLYYAKLGQKLTK
ncbi:hypothetical protein SCAZ3_11060 [Streptococcus canis FSL Z3-227]|uniref:Uncharacterized protein n=1 Tax=Streptococcus canis FSL Z3-227 TaxID=482234 RepID=A0AAV3FVB9_STRCB|nr:hypothetical protein SCAZ3_11060 [Streptococcus canis FSL Z3-227]